MNKILLSIIVSAALSAIACGGSGGGGSSTSTPTAPSASPPAPTSTAVNIVSSAGNGAFSPNPVQALSGEAIVWRNLTSETHVLVMNNGTPIATVGPGASVTTTVSGGGGNYRCITHPSMVGSINGATAPEQPAGDDY